MKWKRRNLDREINEEPDPQQLRHSQTKENRIGTKMFCRRCQLGQVKGKIGLEIEDQHGDQHEHAAKHGVEKEFDGGILPPGSAPDADQEVHRQQHQFPENIEEEKIHGTEDSNHGRIEKKEEREIPLYGTLNAPRSENANWTQERSKQYHRDTDAIDTNEVFDVVSGDPRN